MKSINQIDLSSITNKDSDVYVIDATTLGGNSVSDFALLNGNNMFTGSENYFQGTLAAEEVEVSGEINAKDFGAVWTLPGTAYIGEGIRFSTFDKGGTISATVKGDPHDTTGVLQIDAEGSLWLHGGQSNATIGLSIADDTDNMSSIELSAGNDSGDCGCFELTCSQSQWQSDEIFIETPYTGIHLGDSEIKLEVDRPAAILKLKDGHALMRAEAKVEIYSNRDNARLEITPTEISISNSAFDPADPVFLSYVGGEYCNELRVYCEAYFTTQPIYYGPSDIQLDHRYVRYGKLPWSEFIATYITDTNVCHYDKVEIEINTLLDRKILDGVDSYWIPLSEFRKSNLFFRAALLNPDWLEAGLDGHTVDGLLLKFSGSAISPYITHSDTQDMNSLSVYTPDSTSDQYIYYRVYDWANYPLARDEEWSMSF